MTSSKPWAVIVVTYNSASALRGSASCLRSLAETAEVVVVDNASQDDTIPVALKAGLRVLRMSGNLGLSVANNAGAALTDSPYLMFLNPDVRPARDGLDRLREELDQHRCIAAPTLINCDGTPQPNLRGEPTLLAKLQNRGWVPGGEALHRYLHPREEVPANQSNWLTGAAIALRREDYDALGGWDEEFFLYFEDVDLSLRAADQGLDVVRVPDVRWPHDWARASQNVLSHSGYLHLRSAMRFYRKYPSLLVRVS